MSPLFSSQRRTNVAKQQKRRCVDIHMDLAPNMNAQLKSSNAILNSSEERSGSYKMDREKETRSTLSSRHVLVLTQVYFQVIMLTDYNSSKLHFDKLKRRTLFGPGAGGNDASASASGMPPPQIPFLDEQRANQRQHAGNQGLNTNLTAVIGGMGANGVSTILVLSFYE